MNLHEYQAKEIFRQYQIPLLRGKVARSPEEAEQIARNLAGDRFVVKAQIHAGGRGKAGGVLIVEGAAKVREAAARLLGKRLKTHQTGPDGQPIDLVLVETAIPITREFYAAVALDRLNEKPCLIFSEAGGVEIEEVAQKTPEAVLKQTFPARTGLPPSQAKRISNLPSLNAEQKEVLASIFISMARLFLEKDASLVEINPLAILEMGEWMAIDAKVRLDDNGLEKHPELAKLNDPHQEDPRETEAKKFGLSYVGLEGNIGCMVNGAGLAMATMDLIKLAGGEPANFLDVGGGASKEKVTAAFKIILADPKVQAILVNIFGGIMRCDWIAQGLLNATQQLEVKVPIVVRLQGTNVEEGRRLLADAKRLSLISVDELADAARKVVELAATA